VVIAFIAETQEALAVVADRTQPTTHVSTIVSRVARKHATARVRRSGSTSDVSTQAPPAAE
jgi:hypothetical protein